MGCRILGDSEQACFYDSEKEWAFGPVMSYEALEHFLEWLPTDPRKLSAADLDAKHTEFLATWKYFEDGFCDRKVEKQIADLCLSVVEVNVKREHQSHPYGSTTATERWTEVELKADTVTVEIPPGVKSLPDAFHATYTDEEGVDVGLYFKAPKRNGLPVVDSRLGTVTYAVEIDD